MKTYFIANYKGELIAHDIQTKEKAELILADYLSAHPEAAEDELEILADGEADE